MNPVFKTLRCVQGDTPKFHGILIWVNMKNYDMHRVGNAALGVPLPTKTSAFRNAEGGVPYNKLCKSTEIRMPCPNFFCG